MLHLITGTPGSGKTLYAVSLIMQYVKANDELLKQGKEPRPIYANIDGLTIAGVEKPPEDWRQTPEHSVIFYDEIQQLKPYKKEKNDNDIVNALQIHRHTGHDIYGITQFPTLLHPNFKAVVGLHSHLHRGWGLSAATVYQWAYCVDAPNAPSNKRLAEHSFRFNYPKNLYKYYKSATQHTHKLRIPKKFFAIIAFVFIAAYFAYSQLFAKSNFLTNTFAGKSATESKKTDNTEQATANAVTVPATTVASASVPASTVPPASVPASAPPPMPTLEQQQAQLEQKYLPPHIVEMQKSDVIRPASIVAFGSRCTAYNKWGEPLNIDDDLCRQMLKDGTMPKPRYDVHQQQAVYSQTDIQPPANQPQYVVQTLPASTVPPASVPSF